MALLLLHLLALILILTVISVLVVLAFLILAFFLDFIKDVWNELYATGNIRIVRNEEIKSQLTDLYNVMTLVNKFQEHEWSSYNFGARRLIADILAPSVRLHIDESLEPARYSGKDSDYQVNQQRLRGYAPPTQPHQFHRVR